MAWRHVSSSGAGWGLAVGAVAALFPAVGILGALAVGAGTGAALGAVSGHAAGAMTRDDLKTLGEVLDRGDAGLVVYPPDMADRVSTSITAATARVHATAGLFPASNWRQWYARRRRRPRPPRAAHNHPTRADYASRPWSASRSEAIAVA